MKTLTKIVSVIILHGKGIRRALGTVLLGVAIVMVLLGNQIRTFTSPESVLVYWGAVFLLLFLTLVVAYQDLRAIKRDFRIQKKALFVTTFSDEEFRRKIKEKRPELFRKE